MNYNSSRLTIQDNVLKKKIIGMFNQSILLTSSLKILEENIELVKKYRVIVNVAHNYLDPLEYINSILKSNIEDVIWSDADSNKQDTISTITETTYSTLPKKIICAHTTPCFLYIKKTKNLPIQNIYIDRDNTHWESDSLKHFLDVIDTYGTNIENTSNIEFSFYKSMQLLITSTNIDQQKNDYLIFPTIESNIFNNYEDLNELSPYQYVKLIAVCLDTSKINLRDINRNDIPNLVQLKLNILHFLKIKFNITRENYTIDIYTIHSPTQLHRLHFKIDAYNNKSINTNQYRTGISKYFIEEIILNCTENSNFYEDYKFLSTKKSEDAQYDIIKNIQSEINGGGTHCNLKYLLTNKMSGGSEIHNYAQYIQENYKIQAIRYINDGAIKVLYRKNHDDDTFLLVTFNYSLDPITSISQFLANFNKINKKYNYGDDVYIAYFNCDVNWQITFEVLTNFNVEQIGFIIENKIIDFFPKINNSYNYISYKNITNFYNSVKSNLFKTFNSDKMNYILFNLLFSNQLWSILKRLITSKPNEWVNELYKFEYFYITKYCSFLIVHSVNTKPTESVANLTGYNAWYIPDNLRNSIPVKILKYISDSIINIKPKNETIILKAFQQLNINDSNIETALKKAFKFIDFTTISLSAQLFKDVEDFKSYWKISLLEIDATIINTELVEDFLIKYKLNKSNIIDIYAKAHIFAIHTNLSPHIKMYINRDFSKKSEIDLWYNKSIDLFEFILNESLFKKKYFLLNYIVPIKHIQLLYNINENITNLYKTIQDYNID